MLIVLHVAPRQQQQHTHHYRTVVHVLYAYEYSEEDAVKWPDAVLVLSVAICTLLRRTMDSNS